MGNEVIVPDSQYSGEGYKLNLKNIFTFLSSLDYIKTIETSRALDNIDGRQFFLTGEKQAVILFTYTHTSFWIFIVYIALLMTANLVFDIEPIHGIILISTMWMLFGFWFVNRYTWGDGYLWQITRDFMVNLTIATVFISIATDIVIYFLIPKLYNFVIDWLQSGPKDGMLNALANSVLIWLDVVSKPFRDKVYISLNTFLKVYALVSILKIISFLIPTLFMFYIHNKRKDLKKRLNEILKNIA